MARKDIGIQLDRNNLNNHNDNYKELYDDFKDVVDRVSDEAFNKVIAGSRIDWSQMVDTVNDLPTNVSEGETRGVKSDNKIYRYDGSNWIAIAEINLNPISEVDDRLTTQLADEVNQREDAVNTLRTTKASKTELENTKTDINTRKADKAIINDLQNQINNLILEPGNSDPEIAQSRGAFSVLNDRATYQDSILLKNDKILLGDLKGVPQKGYFNPDGTFTEGEGWYHFLINNGSVKDFELIYKHDTLTVRLMQWDESDDPISRTNISNGSFIVSESCTKFAIVTRLEESDPASPGVTGIPSIRELSEIIIRNKKGITNNVETLEQVISNNLTNIPIFNDDKTITSDELVANKLFNWPDGNSTNSPNWHSYELSDLPLETKQYEVKSNKNGRIRLLKYTDDEYIGNEIIYTNEPFKLDETINRFAISIQAENADPTSSNVDVFTDINDVKLYRYTPQYVNLKDLINIDKTKPFKILMIGNSFADDTARWLGDICKSVKVDTIIGVVEIGGGSLEEHWTNVDSDSNAPFHTYENGNKSSKQNLKYNEIVSYDDWDIITFQQTSALSGMYETFQPYLNNLVTYAKSNATNNDVNIGWLMTWAYSTESERAGFANYNNNQIEMYEAIVSATQKVMEAEDFDIVIPVGTSIQNARSNEYLNNVNDELTRDDYHLDYGVGRYIAALTVFESLVSHVYKKDINNVSFYPKNDGGTRFLSKLSKVAVRNSVINPFKTTKF